MRVSTNQCDLARRSARGMAPGGSTAKKARWSRSAALDSDEESDGGGAHSDDPDADEYVPRHSKRRGPPAARQAPAPAAPKVQKYNIVGV